MTLMIRTVAMFITLNSKEYCTHYVPVLYVTPSHESPLHRNLRTLQVLLYLPQNNSAVNQMQGLFPRHKFACSPHCGTGCRKFRNKTVRWIQTGKFQCKNWYVLSSGSELEMSGGRGHADSMWISTPVAI
jgi:hypothetical protein